MGIRVGPLKKQLTMLEVKHPFSMMLAWPGSEHNASDDFFFRSARKIAQIDLIPLTFTYTRVT